MEPKLRAEHSRLLESVETVLGKPAGLLALLDYGDTQYHAHTQWAYRVQWLSNHLSAALALVNANNYAPAFAIIRVGLEQHLVDRLLFLGDRMIDFARRPKDQTAVQFEEYLEQLKADVGHALFDWTATKKGRYRLKLRAPRFTNDPSRWLSLYNFILEQYDPTAGVAGRPGSLRRNFNGMAEMRAAADQAREYWSDYLTKERVLDNLRLCNLITDHERLQIELHYSFLSGYVHSTAHGYDSIMGRYIQSPAPPDYDHYCSELALLYMARIATEELRFFHRGLAVEATTTIPTWSAIEQDLARADADSAHFWFLGSSGPHAYDRVVSVDDLMFVAAGGDAGRPDLKALLGMKTLNPESLALDQISYDPDPLNRLVALHRDHSELTTRTVYRTPWPRSDAGRR